MHLQTPNTKRLVWVGALALLGQGTGEAHARGNAPFSSGEESGTASESRAAAAPATEALPDVEAGRSARQLQRRERCEHDPRVVLGQVTLAACLGADLFFRETFGGNGRTCGSCHPAANNYTIDRDYIERLADDDPLFVAENNPALAQLEIPSLLRDDGLILVNADGFEAPTEKFVVRSVQHLLGLEVSRLSPPQYPDSPSHSVDGTLYPIPAERLGWSGDGAPGQGTLRDFADGAIAQHATRSLNRVPGVDFFLPTEDEKDAIATFSGSIGRMNDVDLEKVQLVDAGAARGLVTFSQSECGVRCHHNAGALAVLVDSLDPETANFVGFGNVTDDIGTALARLPSVDALGVPLDGGHGRGPRDMDGDGINDSFGNRGMNMPSIIEAADTGPSFHTNAAEGLEDAIRFYTTQTFAESAAAVIPFLERESSSPLPIDETDIAEIGRFLRVINTSLNLQMALTRMDAALQISEQFGNQEWDVEKGLWTLASAELEDAVQVLSAVCNLHEREQSALRRALRTLDSATRHRTSAKERQRQLGRVRKVVAATDAALGQGLSMQIGQGTLLF